MTLLRDICLKVLNFLVQGFFYFLMLIFAKKASSQQKSLVEQCIAKIRKKDDLLSIRPQISNKNSQLIVAKLQMDIIVLVFE